MSLCGLLHSRQKVLTKTLLITKFTTLLLLIACLQVSAKGDSKKTAPPVIITGTVLSSDGKPLSGASVKLKGTGIGTFTNGDGKFTLEAPQENGVLIISFVGYAEQQVSFSKAGEVSVVLTPAVKQQDEVVVGYGTQKKVNLSGSVSSVSGQTITQRPAPNLQNLLQGRITGLDIVQSTGEPGRDNASYRLRGIGSYGASTAPLILVDGVVGSISNLSPQDIESVSVLKDAASASIYGSRAANGVILITTKKGKAGRNMIEYTGSWGTSEATREPELITDPVTYMTMYNQALKRTYGPTRADQYTQDQIDLYKGKAGFNWIDYALGKGPIQQHNLSFSGGVAKTTYNLSLNYMDQDGIMKNYFQKRYNALFDFATQAHERVRVGTNINFSFQDLKAPWQTNDNLLLLAYASAPTFGPFLPDGSGRITHNDFISVPNGSNRSVEEVYASGGQFTKNYNINAQGFAEVDIIKGLKWYSKAAVTFFNQENKLREYATTAYAYNPDANGDYVVTGNGDPTFQGLQQSSARNITKTLFSTLTYATNFGEAHHLTALAGYEQQDNRSTNLSGQRNGFPSPSLIELDAGSPTGQTISGNASEWALRSFFGRANYDYKGKYILEGDIRYDGTSRVDPRYRWGTFGGGSAAWRVSQESFIKDNVSWISDLKLRASYGVLGNQEIGNYPYQDVLNVSATYPFGSSLSPAAILTALVQKDLKWEKTATTDFGVDFDLFHGLFGATVDWYKKTTTDILASRTDVPASVGLSSPIVNAGAVENKGIEIELRHQNRIGEFTYGANFMYHAFKNKITKVLVETLGTFEVGQPMNNFFIYEWAGIFQSQQDIDSWAKQPNSGTLKPGDLKIKDQDGNGTVGPEDRIRISGLPKYNYSFSINAGWKGLSLSAFFQGVQGQNMYVNGWGYEPFAQGSAPPKKFLNAWSPTNPSNTVPALYMWNNYPGVSGYSSTYFLQDASYLRLKNLYLSYTVPQSLVRKIKAQSVTVFVSGDNLITWTKYEGNDPERAGINGRFAQFPQVRILTAGVNLKL